MGKVKIKRKSTLIDMTAMSDVTVLLLTFFMLTSTFLAKEPTVVITPSSVSEEAVPMSNLVTVLVSAKDMNADADGAKGTEGKVFLSFLGNADSTMVASGPLRAAMLKKAVEIYNKQIDEGRRKNAAKIQLTDGMVKTFTELASFGVDFPSLPAYLDPNMSLTERDKLQGDMTNPHVGIPYDLGNANRNKERFGNLNDFQIWLEAIQEVAPDIRRELQDKFQRIVTDSKEGSPEQLAALAQLQEVQNADFQKDLKGGKAIAVKADKDTPYEVVEAVFDNLQTMNLNKFTLMTALKAED